MQHSMGFKDGLGAGKCRAVWEVSRPLCRLLWKLAVNLARGGLGRLAFDLSLQEHVAEIACTKL